MNARKGLMVVLAAGLAVGGAAAAMTIGRHDAAPAPHTTVPSTRRAAPLQPPSSSTVAVTGEADVHGPAWSIEKVMRLIDGAGATVEGRFVRIKSATALCSGSGEPQRAGRVRRWRAFDCTYTVFAGGIDRDVEFHVDVVGGKRYRLSGFEWVGGR